MKAACLLLLILLSPLPAPAGDAFPHLWGGFATSLNGRSAEQRGNAGRAATDLNGVLVYPAATFSFNEHVGMRDPMKGYVPAPFINDRGYLSDVPGGGICQLATTIYNAALEAGMEIIERHPHSRAVGYVPPGRDATILTWRKDLKLRNPHPLPLLLKVRVVGDRLAAGFWSVEERGFRTEIRSDIIPIEPDTAVSGPAENNGAPPQKGRRGFSVITRRSVVRGDSATDEILSRDFYPAPSRILAVEGE